MGSSAEQGAMDLSCGSATSNTVEGIALAPCLGSCLDIGLASYLSSILLFVFGALCYPAVGIVCPCGLSTHTGWLVVFALLLATVPVGAGGIGWGCADEEYDEFEGVWSPYWPGLLVACCWML